MQEEARRLGQMGLQLREQQQQQQAEAQRQNNISQEQDQRYQALERDYAAAADQVRVQRTYLEEEAAKYGNAEAFFG